MQSFLYGLFSLLLCVSTLLLSFMVDILHCFSRFTSLFSNFISQLSCLITSVSLYQCNCFHLCFHISLFLLFLSFCIETATFQPDREQTLRPDERKHTDSKTGIQSLFLYSGKKSRQQYSGKKSRQQACPYYLSSIFCRKTKLNASQIITVFCEHSD